MKDRLIRIRIEKVMISKKLIFFRSDPIFSGGSNPGQQQADPQPCTHKV